MWLTSLLIVSVLTEPICLRYGGHIATGPPGSDTRWPASSGGGGGAISGRGRRQWAESWGSGFEGLALLWCGLGGCVGVCVWVCLQPLAAGWSCTLGGGENVI